MRSFQFTRSLWRPRWHKVTADLWGNKVRSFLVISSIAVGLFAVGLITSMYVLNGEDMEAGYSSVNPASIQVFTSLYEEDVLTHIRHVEGVRQVQGEYIFSLRVRRSGGEWKPIDIHAIPSIEQMDINRVHLEKGVWPPRDKEIVVDSYKLPELPVGVGGLLELELPSSRTRSLRLVGAINDQTIGSTGGGGFFLAPAQGYITLETLDWLELPNNQMNVIFVTVDRSPNDYAYLREVGNRVSDAVEQSGVTVYSTAIRAANDHPNRVYVDAISAVLFVLGFLVMFLSGFLITNTLSALLNQQVHQIGVMKTIGGRRGQIMGIYMVQIFIFGLLAFSIAMPLSSQVSYSLLGYFSQAVNTQQQGFRVVPVSVVLQLVVALIVPQVAAFIPILHGTRISAVEAMSGYSQSNPPNPKGWINQRLHDVRGLSRPLLLSLRNTFRRRGRLFLTLFTLTLGGAIFIGTFNVERSLSSYIERIGRYFMADVNLTFKQYYRIEEIESAIKEIPGVRQVEGWTAASGELMLPDGSVGETTRLLAPPSQSELVSPILLEGRWLGPADADSNVITVNERFRETYPNLKPGDIIQVKIAGRERDLQVVGFFRLAGKSSGYLAYGTYEYLSRVIHQPNRANTFRVRSEQPRLNLQEQQAMGRQIETHLEALGYQLADVEAGESLTATTADGLNILTIFLLIMALLIAVVGSIGLMGTMSLNVMERTREIGILRAIGASDRAVMELVLVEGALIGLMSWVFGVLLAFPISSLMSNAINLALFGAAADFTFTPTGVFLWLGVVSVLSVLASVGPARNATRLTIREVLAYE